MASWTACDDYTSGTWYWRSWCNDAFSVASTNSTTNTTSAIWYNWNSTATTGNAISFGYLVGARPAEVTAEELAEDRRRQEEYLRKQREASERARQLLLANLTPEQRAAYEKHKLFVVQGKKLRYRLRGDVGHNIDVIDERGVITHRLCAVSQQTIPNADLLLAQKLMIEAEEDELLRVAYKHNALNKDERVLPALLKEAA